MPGSAQHADAGMLRAWGVVVCMDARRSWRCCDVPFQGPIVDVGSPLRQPGARIQWQRHHV